MKTPNPPEYFRPSSIAMDVFADYLSRVSIGPECDFEAFCTGHSELAASLKQLFEEWKLLNPGRGRFRTKQQFRDRLLQLYGGQDPPSDAIAVDETPGVRSENDPHHTDGAPALLASLNNVRPEREKYIFRGKVDIGGMGVVWRVFDKQLRRHLAMKMMKDLAQRQPAEQELHQTIQIRRFLEEAQVTGQLDHPGIVPIHSLGIDEGGRLYFTMKLVKGRDLRSIFEFVKTGADGWTETRALSVLLRVCEAVSYAHAKGVIHRDLKPGNIMVGRFGEVFVMDWGVARVLTKPDLHDRRITNETPDLSTVHSVRRDTRESDPDSPLVTMDGSVVGTPAYMAPEQAMGLLNLVTQRSDVYSIGAILYQLLAGHMPYVPPGTRLSQKTLLGLVVLGPPPPILQQNPNAPRALVAICEKAMSRDPMNRYESAKHLAADLELYLDRRPVSAAHPSLLKTARLWMQRNRALAIAVASASLLMMASSLVFVVQLKREVDAKSLAILETETYRDGLRADRLLRTIAHGLYPLAPSNIAQTELWLREASELCANLPARREELKKTGASSPYIFEIRRIVESLESLELQKDQAATRLEFAKSASRRSVEQFAIDWKKASADILASELYHHYPLDPQAGLIPLQKDPKSQLWEFLLLDSGDAPQIETSQGDPATKRYKITDSTGVIFVLLPGGAYRRGARETDAESDVNEASFDVNLAPFFLSKYETTQAQWMRYFGNNPSGKRPPHDRYKIAFNLTNPVETVSWHFADAFCRAFDCSLPTESQWEYAARAGTSNLYYWNGGEELIQQFENAADANYAAIQSDDLLLERCPWNDGATFHTRVGSYQQNPFGLFDMLGNVSEWVSDWYTRDPLPVHSSNGSVEAIEQTTKVFRGGSFHDQPAALRCAFRRFVKPEHANYNIGFRMARAVATHRKQQ
ncbi:MAG: SUMF1/EgtB/PvdO family nonheme iron enzyme [Planctomycetota bacterium]